MRAIQATLGMASTVGGVWELIQSSRKSPKMDLVLGGAYGCAAWLSVTTLAASQQCFSWFPLHLIPFLMWLELPSCALCGCYLVFACVFWEGGKSYLLRKGLKKSYFFFGSESWDTFLLPAKVTFLLKKS